MSFYVFLGPTLSVEHAKAEFDAIYCPPAAVGDVYRVATTRPQAIGIVDGFFERTPSVWHKEILWALSEGIEVFGAASMGALRAAELAPFGMVGVGQVFSSFQTGALEDDDEVAIAHATAEHGYRSLSEPMVNIRATLLQAERVGVLSENMSNRLRDLAKCMFYADRSYEGMLRAAVANSGATSELMAFREWLPSNRVDVKRDDARSMLRLMRERYQLSSTVMPWPHRFEHTHAWASLQRRYRPEIRRASITQEEERVFDELRLRGGFLTARRGALTRALALAEARESGKPISVESMHETAVALRRELGLISVESFRNWLLENGLTLDELDAFLRDETRFRWVDRVLEDAATNCLADHLRASGEYGALRRRALEKQRILSERNIDETGDLSASAGDEPTIWRWYFEQKLLLPCVPDDLTECARQLGFRDQLSFRRAVLLEYLSQ